MLAAWHPTRWRNWCVSVDIQKKIEPFLLIKRSIDCLVLFQPK